MEALPSEDEQLLVDVVNNIKEGEMNLRQPDFHAASICALAQINGGIFVFFSRCILSYSYHELLLLVI